MPAGMGYGPEAGLPPEAMMAGMDQMIGGPPPPGATELPSSEGGESDVVAALALENVQLRALLGLGPDDPIPMPEGGGPAPVGGAPAGPAPF